MLKEIREVMGLSLEQVADELKLTPQQVALLEEKDDEKYIKLFISAFPINWRILYNRDIDPFLPSYDQTSPGKRLYHWMLKYRISACYIADILGMDVSKILLFLKSDIFTLSRAEGEKLEKELGINRKWLMYGDGRNKGKPRSSVIISGNFEIDKEKSILERMSDDFKKLPDEKIKSKSDILSERKKLGLKVREARKKLNLSIKEAAEILQVSASRVAQLECGIITQRKAEEVLLKYKTYGEVKRCGLKGTNKETDDQEMPGNIQEWNESFIHITKHKSESGIFWGNRIQKARKEAGLSQQDVGDMIGKSHATISLLEKGRVNKNTAEYLIKLMNEKSNTKG